MSKESNYIGQGIATLGVCGLGVLLMHLSNGATGVGWAILGVLIIWGTI